ncbi:response regulator [Brachybacterium paraconglomeratum]|uniref:response regulator n=1 Tax=Brachybacterium paraconglomeratum TaxID=173362 RepID=UPI00223AA402|nr:response regulator transcription factor [Brachybacterium paraconglomeratum]MCT1437987.1 response regulator transcription factor [Brachybacterium paraconglomeratum]
MTPPVRIVLVDDQELLRRGLAMLLSTVEDIDIVGQAADGAEALAVIGRFAPDVVLADVRMPVMDGIELVSRCRDDHPGLPVLLLTTFDDEPVVQGSLAAGAAGFLLKDTSTEALAEALRSVAAGGMVIDPRVARIALARDADRGRDVAAGDDPLAVLTRAEHLVAEQLAEGRTNAEIADELVLAEGTVKNHVSALLRKLGERDRTALALTLYKTLHG